MTQSSIDGSAKPGPALSADRRALLAAVADPVRVELLALLRQQKTVSEICCAMDMAQPRVSHHLAVLRRVGLLVAEVRGRQRPHRWTDPPPGSAPRAIQELLESWFESRPAAVVGSQKGPAGSIEDFLL